MRVKIKQKLASYTNRCWALLKGRPKHALKIRIHCGLLHEGFHWPVLIFKQARHLQTFNPTTRIYLNKTFNQYFLRLTVPHDLTFNRLFQTGVKSEGSNIGRIKAGGPLKDAPSLAQKDHLVFIDRLHPHMHYLDRRQDQAQAHKSSMPSERPHESQGILRSSHGETNTGKKGTAQDDSRRIEQNSLPDRKSPASGSPRPDQERTVHEIFLKKERFLLPAAGSGQASALFHGKDAISMPGDLAAAGKDIGADPFSSGGRIERMIREFGAETKSREWDWSGFSRHADRLFLERINPHEKECGRIEKLFVERGMFLTDKETANAAQGARAPQRRTIRPVFIKEPSFSKPGHDRLPRDTESLRQSSEGFFLKPHHDQALFPSASVLSAPTVAVAPTRKGSSSKRDRVTRKYSTVPSIEEAGPIDFPSRSSAPTAKIRGTDTGISSAKAPKSGVAAPLTKPPMPQPVFRQTKQATLGPESDDLTVRPDMRHREPSRKRPISAGHIPLESLGDISGRSGRQEIEKSKMIFAAGPSVMDPADPVSKKPVEQARPTPEIPRRLPATSEQNLHFTTRMVRPTRIILKPRKAILPIIFIPKNQEPAHGEDFRFPQAEPDGPVSVLDRPNKSRGTVRADTMGFPLGRSKAPRFSRESKIRGKRADDGGFIYPKMDSTRTASAKQFTGHALNGSGPGMREPEFILKKEGGTGRPISATPPVQEKAASMGMDQILYDADAKKRQNREIHLIADRVYRILEKRIAVERDRRGLI